MKPTNQMIEANELRIGNYFQIHSAGKDIFFRVSQISKTGVSHGTTGQSGYRLFTYKMINPIPINKEWLSKFGFKEWGENMMHVDAWSPGHPSQRFDIDWREDMGIITKSRYQGDRFDDFKMRHINCVHRLQNLFFSLTGQELSFIKSKT